MSIGWKLVLIYFHSSQFQQFVARIFLFFLFVNRFMVYESVVAENNL